LLISQMMHPLIVPSKLYYYYYYLTPKHHGLR
jgi:hypothetical protein